MRVHLPVLLWISLGFLAFAGAYREIRIGGIFAEDSTELESAFKLAVEAFNGNHSNDPFRAVALTSHVDLRNALQVSREVCKLLSAKIVGIFGPSHGSSSYYVQSACDDKEMPHIETHWDRHLQRSSCAVNLHPHPDSLRALYAELVRLFGWKAFTILYENEESLPRIGELLTMLQNRGAVSVRPLGHAHRGNFRPLLQAIKRAGESNFVLDCSVETLEEFLRQAQQVSLMTEKESYIITNLDLQTVDLTPYQYSGCNITGMRLVDPESRDIITLAADLLQMKKSRNGEDKYMPVHSYAWKIRLETVLLMDSVKIFLEALKDLSLTKRVEGKQLYCHIKDNWEHGYSLINSMKTKNVRGLSGMIRFDNQGYRSNYQLDIVELLQNGLVKIGVWNSTESLNITRRYEEALEPVVEGTLKGMAFRVLIALTPPYAMLKETTTKLAGNDRFEGFGIDLIKELSAMLAFNYTFMIQEDGQNGNFDRHTKTWNGMIGEIIEDRADLAICDLTITSERLRDVDFTNPFMSLGISILYKKPEPMPPSLFTFASPFSASVWLLLGVAYVIVSILFFVIARLCPSEWNNPYPCVDEPEYLINQFSFRNSFWFTIGSFMTQGTEIAPVGISTRMAAGVWWFFTLILVSCYTANLAAFLTIETLVTPFKNIDELAKQKEVKYGAKKGGATYNFFRDSNLTTHKNIFEYMFNHPDFMTLTNEEGVDRVKNENYAFLMESTTIEYMVERHCTLDQVGGLLDDKGYGIAMKKNSPLRNILSAAIVKLQETGRTSDFKVKWWKEDRGGGNCERRASTATPLDLKNLGGVFFVLTLGTFVGVLCSLLEFGYHTNKKAKEQKKVFKAELKREFRLFLQFQQMERQSSNNDT